MNKGEYSLRLFAIKKDIMIFYNDRRSQIYLKLVFFHKHERELVLVVDKILKKTTADYSFKTIKDTVS